MLSVTGRRWVLVGVEFALVVGASYLLFSSRMVTFPDYAPPEGPRYFIGTDPYFHLREILYNLHHFPRNLRFDPFTYYPVGTRTGQFGTLYDTLASFLLLVGSGFTIPDRRTVETFAVAYPALLGALVAFPFYYVARPIVGRVGALFGLAVLVFLPGEFYVRSVAGYTDHHVAEVLFSTLATLGLLGAVRSARKYALSLETLTRTSLRPLSASLVGGVLLALYFFVWPPAVFFVGIFVAALVLQGILDHLKGESLDPLMISSAVVFLTAFLLLLPTPEILSFPPSEYGLLQPLSTLSAALLCVGMLLVSRRLRLQGLPLFLFPGGVLGSIVVALLLVSAIFPSFGGVLKWGLGWVTPFFPSNRTLTIAEAQPSCRGWDLFGCPTMISSYGIFLVAASVGALLLLVRFALQRTFEDSLLLVWSFFTLLAAYSQVRFQYYLAIPLAILAALPVGWLSEWTGMERSIEDLKGGSARNVAQEGKRSRGRRTRERSLKTPGPALKISPWVVAVLLLLPGNLLPSKDSEGRSAYDCASSVIYRPSFALGPCLGVDPDVRIWTDALLWLRNSTPEGGVDLTRTPAPNERGNYGVASWWDYGHWTEVIAERAPVANNFQEGAPLMSKVLTSRSEEEANALLDDWVLTQGGPGFRPVRYLMISDEDAGGKYGAITVWANTEMSRGTREYTIEGLGKRSLPLFDHDSFLQKLYFEDSRGFTTWRLVYEYPRLSRFLTFLSLSGGGFGQTSSPVGVLQGNETPTPSHDPDFIRRDGDAVYYDLWYASSLKIFERVQGAKIEGRVRPGERVEVLIDLLSYSLGPPRGFRWSAQTVADPSGHFEVRVPYSTTDYLSPKEGGTATRVLASGPARVLIGSSLSPRVELPVSIPDRSVLEGETILLPDQG